MIPAGFTPEKDSARKPRASGDDPSTITTNVAADP